MLLKHRHVAGQGAPAKRRPHIARPTAADQIAGQFSVDFGDRILGEYRHNLQIVVGGDGQFHGMLVLRKSQATMLIVPEPPSSIEPIECFGDGKRSLRYGSQAGQPVPS